jgi:hypothetical protein
MNTSTHIDFCIKGPSLNTHLLTAFLGVSATSGFNPNEPYWGKEKRGGVLVSVERRRPPFGVWHFSTEGKISGKSVEDHARFLLASLQPARMKIESLLQSSAYETRLSIWYVGPNGFDISSDVLSQLTTLCTSFDVRFIESGDDVAD